MRREIAHFLPDLPIGVRILNIKEYPLSWRNSIQILHVLEGSISVTVEYEEYELKENYVDIINTDEVYSFKSDVENKVMILDIDPSFFERYYDDAREVFYYTDTADQQGKEDEKYYKLRRLIAVVAYEAIKKFDDYEEFVEENVLELMYHLLNDFHYLYYEGEDTNWSEENFNRSHRIVKYISNNYMNKVSLQDLAEQEFLTSQYLSFKIKDTFGQTFNDYVNQIRVEESTKLLLDTNKSVAEISEDVGFSHVRYYNKHFKLNYGLTPVQYRKKNSLSEKAYLALHEYKEVPVEQAIDIFKSYIEDYERYDYDNRIIKIDLDLDSEPIKDYNRPNVIDLGDVYLLLELENREMLIEIQREINLEFGIIHKLFSEDMDVYRGANHKFINWTRVENLLDFIHEVGLKPVILTEGTEDFILEDFISNFEDKYENIENYLFDSLDEFGFYYTPNQIKSCYDKVEIAPFMIYSYVEAGKNLLFSMIDEINRDTILDNETFFGGDGIFTNNYFKKPSYYALMLLGSLGDKVIMSGEGYLVTRSEGEFQILLYNPIDYDYSNLKESINERKIIEKRFSINIKNMKSDFQVIRYNLSKNSGSVYDKWMGLNSPERLDDDTWELLSEYVHPEIIFHYMKKRPISNLYAKAPAHSATLFILSEYE